MTGHPVTGGHIRAERCADDRGPGRVSLARLPYREPAPELAAAVDRFLAVRDLRPTSRRSYRQVLTALTASYGTAAAVTWNRAATIVRGFAGWCAEQGWTEEDQLPRLAKLTRRRRPRPPADRVLTVEVIDGLCAGGAAAGKNAVAAGV